MIPKPPHTRNLQDDLKKFIGEAQRIIASFVNTLAGAPPIIYHYTDDAGLRGILETGHVWLTNIFNLNDPSELRHGICHALNILKGMVANGPPESKEFAEGLAAFFRQVGIEESGHYFICSFSSCRDDLGQWRAYGDDGRGYALGFDATVLENGFTGGSPPNTEAFRITYKDNELDNRLRQIIESYRRALDLDLRLQSGVSMGDRADLYTWLTVYLVRTALFFKHEAYDNEQEYRFLQLYGADELPPNMKVRTRPYSLIRYKEFDWRSVAAGALNEIVVGPAAHHEKASRFARDCLHLFHGKTVPITYSSIPYRAI
jgi:hypothetical protein